MIETEEDPGSGSLEDPTVPAQDSDVPDPTAARDDPGTSDAIDGATHSAKDEIAAALDVTEAGEEEPQGEEGQEAGEDEPEGEQQG